MEEKVKNERQEFYEFLDALFDKVDEEKKEMRKTKRKWMRFGKFLAVRLPQTLFEGVEKIAYETGETVSEVVRQALKEFLSNSKELLKENSNEGKQVENEVSKEALKQFLVAHEEEIKAYFKEKESNKKLTETE
jgi:hypothetical protein